MMATIKVTAANFAKEVLEASQPVIVDFWAAWCPPCQMLAPVIEAIADEHPEYKVCKVNVDEESALATNYNVTTIPLVMMFKNGKISGHTVGYQEKDRLLRTLEL